MAKWGEGDPRWIVEERPDATNVNNWHWTEKNATQWSKDKLKSLLVGMKAEHDQYSFEITELTTCEGEATANNRKKKLIFFYEWVLKGEWKGSLPDSDEFKGKFEVPNLSEENGVEDLEVIITMEDTSSDALKLKEHMHKKGSKLIVAKLGSYIEDLKTEFSEGIILPDANKDANNINNVTKERPASPSNSIKKQMNDVVESSTTTFNAPLRTKKINQTVELQCEAANIYNVLTDQNMVSAFTRSDASVNAEVGGSFSLIGGAVSGTFTELVHDSKIAMRWRAQHWPKDHYSQVAITLKQKDCTTDIQLVQTGVPEQDYDKMKEGWHRFYWGPIKQTFGFGTRLF